MPLAPELLALLACPVDKGPLLYDPQTESLYNPRLRRAYAVVDGIPHLLADEARPVGRPDHERLTGTAAPAADREPSSPARPA
nr:Trm112 family protein [Streptacidiphilus jiangxiensis]